MRPILQTLLIVLCLGTIQHLYGQPAIACIRKPGIKKQKRIGKYFSEIIAYDELGRIKSARFRGLSKENRPYTTKEFHYNARGEFECAIIDRDTAFYTYQFSDPSDSLDKTVFIRKGANYTILKYDVNCTSINSEYRITEFQYKMESDKKVLVDSIVHIKHFDDKGLKKHISIFGNHEKVIKKEYERDKYGYMTRCMTRNSEHPLKIEISTHEYMYNERGLPIRDKFNIKHKFKGTDKIKYKYYD